MVQVADMRLKDLMDICEGRIVALMHDIAVIESRAYGKEFLSLMKHSLEVNQDMLRALRHFAQTGQPIRLRRSAAPVAAKPVIHTHVIAVSEHN